MLSASRSVVMRWEIKKVIPSRQPQVIQSLDGGVVSEILVQEGQVVEVCYRVRTHTVGQRGFKHRHFTHSPSCPAS